MNLTRLAMVLKHANSSPPSYAREDFYRLKEAVLQTYGTIIGEDLQHIRKPCWSCTDGWYRHVDGDQEQCFRCGGSGIYSERWIILERWELAGQVFHRPVRTVVGSLLPATIEGKIEHKRFRLSEAAWRVLTLLLCPQYYLYLDQFKMNEKQLRRFKAVLAYLLEFDRNKWRVEAVKFKEIQEAHKRMVDNLPIPF